MEKCSTLLALCAGNSPVTGEFPVQRPVTWSCDVFPDMCLTKWLSKQSCGCWLRPLTTSLRRTSHNCTWNAHMLNLRVVYRSFTAVLTRDISTGYLDVGNGNWLLGRKRQKIKCYFRTFIHDGWQRALLCGILLCSILIVTIHSFIDV